MRARSFSSHGGGVEPDRPMGMGLRLAGVWYRPRRGGLHRVPREQQDGPGLARDWENRYVDRIQADGCIAAIQELERGGHLPVRTLEKVGGKNRVRRQSGINYRRWVVRQTDQWRLGVVRQTDQVVRQTD